MGIMALPFFLPTGETEEGAVRDGGGPILVSWATAAAGIEGERERELRGIDPLPHLPTAALQLRRGARGGGVARGGGCGARGGSL